MEATLSLASKTNKENNKTQIHIFITLLLRLLCLYYSNFLNLFVTKLLIQWNLSKLTTDRSWNSGQHKQVVNLHKCVPK